MYFRVVKSASHSQGSWNVPSSKCVRRPHVPVSNGSGLDPYFSQYMHCYLVLGIHPLHTVYLCSVILFFMVLVVCLMWLPLATYHIACIVMGVLIVTVGGPGGLTH